MFLILHLIVGLFVISLLVYGLLGGFDVAKPLKYDSANLYEDLTKLTELTKIQNRLEEELEGLEIEMKAIKIMENGE